MSTEVGERIGFNLGDSSRRLLVLVSVQCCRFDRAVNGHQVGLYAMMHRRCDFFQ